ncbi:MAG: DUF4421 domain-containing protein [Bacteroidaceae bacterium]|nr:DUF4421 domain-containing protein [Bacteroidaceae bacterium]
MKNHLVKIASVCCVTMSLYSVTSPAQETNSWLHNTIEKLDALLDARSITTDTDYVARPRQPWTLKARYRLASNYFSTIDNYGGNDYKYFFESDFRTSAGVSANYRGLSVSLSVKTSRQSGTELTVNYYNNKFGIDLGYTNTTHFSASENFADLWRSDDHKDDLGDTRLTAYSLNGYYVFNHSRFSFPAAFSHSWIQKRSAGSFIAGFSFYTGEFDVDLSLVNPKKAVELHYWIDKANMNYVSVNFGYAYNFVIKRRWLLHASIVPGIMLWKNYTADVMKLDVNPSTGKVVYGEIIREGWPKRFFDNTGTIRLSVNYSFSKSFVGFSTVHNFESIGDKDVGTVFGNRWMAQVYYGIRL